MHSKESCNFSATESKRKSLGECIKEDIYMGICWRNGRASNLQLKIEALFKISGMENVIGVQN